MKQTVKMLNNFFAEFYGGKLSFLRAVYYAGQAKFGVFDIYKNINWSKISRLVFVCKGNICRSAYAQYKSISLGGSAASAGLAADGKPADATAQRVANQRQVNLQNHHSQSIQEITISSGDLLIAFEPIHAEYLSALVHDRTDVQVTLVGLWGIRPFWVYMHDPYGMSDAYFNNCFKRIDKSINYILNQLSINSSMAIING